MPISLRPYFGPATKLVIAFDIGTTYSAVSYTILEPSQAPDVLAVNRFPAQGIARSDPKVPSLLYYDRAGTVRAAGAEVLTEEVMKTALSQGWMKAEWWKLHLCPKHLLDHDLPPLPSKKSAVDVLADFIKYLFHCTKSFIQENQPTFAWSSGIEHSTEYILTYPGGWHAHQHLYQQAAERADLVPSTHQGRSRVHVLTEGEASLHFCAARLLNLENQVSPQPEGIVIIDAGGGTVGLSMFSMSFNAISCEEIAPAESRLQGSVFVTRRASALMQRKLDGWEHSGAENIAQFTREFDQSTKRFIRSDQEPTYVKVAGRRTSISRFSISSGQLKLSGDEGTGLFNEPIDAIISAFELQLQRKTAAMPVTTAIILGSFSNNDWLHSRLRLYFQGRNINFCRPDNYIDQTVPNGALLAYIDHHSPLAVRKTSRVSCNELTESENNALDVDFLSAQGDNSSAFVDSVAGQQTQAATTCGYDGLFQHDAETMQLRQCVDTLSAELDSAREELGIKIKEKEVMIASLTTEVARLKQSDDEKTAQISSQIAELQKRCDAQSGLGAFQQWKSKCSLHGDKPILNGNSADVWVSINSSAAADKPSAIGHISKAIALVSRSELEKAMQAFDLAFPDCNSNESNLLLLIKAIMFYVAEKHNNAISRVHDLIANLNDDELIYCCTQVLAKMHIMRGNYELAAASLERGQNLSCAGGQLEIISIIFGWTFDGFRITMLRCRCQVFLTAGRAEEATETLIDILNIIGKDMDASQLPWLPELKDACISMVEQLGDAALGSANHEEAIARYSSALDMNPSNRLYILVKRSKARASKKLWDDALRDADEVIKLDPLSHRGYERKYVALLGSENYGGANNALFRMISIIEKSTDEDVRRLRLHYTNPREAINAIDTAILEIFRLSPLVLIDLTTGRLCDAHERVRVFKSETPFLKLLSEIVVSKLDYPHIRRNVANYFQWVMFSHTWEGREPTFQDVNAVNSVWSLGQLPQNEKLRQFCTISREDGHRWAWSDTCCIDKSTGAILSQSLASMYRWYEEAAETLVHLADVLSSAKLGDLSKSRWMTRAWTLQELLASRVIRFYTRDWKPYLKDTHRNHKDSSLIKQELARAIRVAPETITCFRPNNLRVREKLRLASVRNATMEEDIAYSLIGIFSSSIRPQYGLGTIALGELLENIIDRSGDVSVIAWTGKSLSLSYNSALPNTLAVYSQVPYNPPPVEASELERCAERVRNAFETQDDTLATYCKVVRLPRARFSNRCLRLPCICFSVTRIGVQELDDIRGNLYRAVVSLLGKVEFRTTDAMPLSTPRRLVFVHPWLHDLRDPLHDFVFDDEELEATDVCSDDEETESNAGLGGSDDEVDVSSPTIPLLAQPSAQVDRYRQALQLIARLGRPFNALLFEWQSNDQYRRVATEHQITLPGVPYETNPKSIRTTVLEVI